MRNLTPGEAGQVRTTAQAHKPSLSSPADKVRELIRARTIYYILPVHGRHHRHPCPYVADIWNSDTHRLAQNIIEKLCLQRSPTRRNNSTNPTNEASKESILCKLSIAAFDLHILTFSKETTHHVAFASLSSHSWPVIFIGIVVVLGLLTFFELPSVHGPNFPVVFPSYNEKFHSAPPDLLIP